jgi:hypothetical protein
MSDTVGQALFRNMAPKDMTDRFKVSPRKPRGRDIETKSKI